LLNGMLQLVGFPVYGKTTDLYHSINPEYQRPATLH
jgi:hypothetical protein